MDPQSFTICLFARKRSLIVLISRSNLHLQTLCQGLSLLLRYIMMCDILLQEIYYFFDVGQRKVFASGHPDKRSMDTNKDFFHYLAF